MGPTLTETSTMRVMMTASTRAFSQLPRQKWKILANMLRLSAGACRAEQGGGHALGGMQPTCAAQCRERSGGDAPQCGSCTAHHSMAVGITQAVQSTERWRSGLSNRQPSLADSEHVHCRLPIKPDQVAV